MKGKNSTDNLSLAVGSHWEILPGLSFDPQLSIYKTNGDSRSFQQAYYNGPTSYIATRSATGTYGKRTQYQADAVLSYGKSFGKGHNLDAKVGLSFFQRDTLSLYAAGQGASSDLIPTLNASAVPVSVSGSESRQVLVGYFSRINYDYNGKYLVSLSARYDGASNLGSTHQWGIFPGVSAGWNVHREEFWKNIPENLLRLKLRASYGINGNISGLGDFQSQGQYSVGSQYNGNAGITNTVLPNPNLQWERSKTIDLGTDIGLLDNRISILFDYYRRITDNLITSLSLPESTGFAAVSTNLGSLENKGIELEIRADVLPASSPVQWVVSFNAAKTRQKILRLPDNLNENNRIGGVQVWDEKLGALTWKGGLQEGGRVGDMFSYKQLGIYATDEEASTAPVDNLISRANKTKYGGDVKWLDADGNGIIDATDRVYVGNPFPVWTGGLSNSLTYKGVNLFMRMDYTTGHTIFNYPRAQMIGQFQGDVAISKEALKSWKQPGDITDIPKYYWADQNAQNNVFRGALSANGSNSMYYESGDFLCLREVTLSYDLPKSLLSKVKVNNLRLNVTANNLGYITKYKGLNPEDILAQAHAMRAYVYFCMVKTWGALPIVTEPTEDFSPEAIQKERSPVEAVFDLIKKDIGQAQALFPGNAFAAGRNTWSKPALLSLKGDVYLWTAKRMNGGQADLTTALEALNEVKTTDVALLDNYSSVFEYVNKGNKEILFAVNFKQNEVTDNDYANMYFPATYIPADMDSETSAALGVAAGLNTWAPAEAFRSQFASDDQRKNGTFREIYSSVSGTRKFFGSFNVKFRGFVNAGARLFLDDYVVYRYADVLLMIAEAKNALGQDPASEINLVRKRAYQTNFTTHQFVSGTRQVNDEAILNERLLELGLEGKRWWDLVRFGKAFEKVPSLKGREENEYLLLFPIPQSTLSLESKVKQNPGYN